MNYKDQNKIAGETENLSSDEQNVARLLSGLKRVDAPKDFDFHLKARIANASPGDYKPVRLFPVLRYVMPLFLLLVGGGAFLLNSSYSGDGNVTTVAEVPPVSSPGSGAGQAVVPKVIDPVPVNESVVAGAERDTYKPQTARDAIRTTQRLPANRSNSRPVPGGGSIDFRSGPGGSYDIAGNKAPDPRLPRFSNSSNSNSSGNGSGTAAQPLELRQMLRALGIEAEFEEKGWRVRTLTKNGVAEQAGLQTGDLMEAIDDKPISTLYDGNFGATSISVRRGGELRKIDVKPKNP
jgi:hypothetical protein